MNRVPLFEEFRLIERSENEISGAWKGAHLLLFFLTFVFGSFCTFCFHMLMYLFDEKCVLFPKLLSLTSSRHNVIYEFIPEKKDGELPTLPVDFLSAQWIEKSACYLPTFVPLLSGIFGLVWITMFLMCSTGSRNLTGLQRPWRVLPPVFLFSLAMSALCIYSSTVTHYGLKQLCVKLSQITGSSTCSYTVNVATLAYERRIRGVYQATWLIVISAWLHTGCWVLSAALALLRILLVVDFQLVRVRVDLVGDADKLLENREEQIKTVYPGPGESLDGSTSSGENLVYHYRSASVELRDKQQGVLHFADKQTARYGISELSLVLEERNKLARLEAYNSVPKSRQFLVKLLYDFFDNIEFPQSRSESDTSPSISSSYNYSSESLLGRKLGQETITLPPMVLDQESETIEEEIKRNLQVMLREIGLPTDHTFDTINISGTGTSNKKGHIAFVPSDEPNINVTTEMKQILKETGSKKSEIQIPVKKSNLKSTAIQTDGKKQKRSNNRRVSIMESKSTFIESPLSAESQETDEDQQDHLTKITKESQTKEKQD